MGFRPSLVALPPIPVNTVQMGAYQQEASRTGIAWDGKPFNEHRMLLAMGLGGEAGEVLELIKKEVGHGQKRSLPKMLEELGDLLWYLSELARIHGFTLDDVAAANVVKLRKRYPDGFVEGGGVR